jgi:hypothetical protein
MIAKNDLLNGLTMGCTRRRRMLRFNHRRCSTPPQVSRER